MERINPATGASVETYETHDSDDVDRLLELADEAATSWAETELTTRRTMLEHAGSILHERIDRYAELMTEEMGKPIGQSRAEVEKCAWVCEYYAENAAAHLQDERFPTNAGAETYVTYEPLGPTLCIMPWNFPFWQVFRFAAPALAAGNVALLKHASNVPGCALAIEEIFGEAGCPEGVFTTLLVGSDRIDDVIADDRLAAVTLTGSEGAGRSVGETAGSNLKKHVLELGGSDPFVVLEDAPIAETARKATQARTINGGQSCIAAKRFVVVEEVYEEFLDAFTEEMASLTVGDPTDEATDVGPQAREDLAAGLQDQVDRTVDAGATVHLGGEPLDREGFFYPPTILVDVPRDSPAATEELFGPVAPVFAVADEEEAISLANDSRFGLGASVWTADRARGERVAREFETGLAFVNDFVKSDPRVPFGGVKDSGYGRELSRHGIREFVNTKTVSVVHDVDDEGDLVE